MTATEILPLRVTVTDVWDQIDLGLPASATVGEVKREALSRALGRPVSPEDYVVKFHGALVLDESLTLGGLGAGANAPLIVVPARRRPVR